MGNKTKSTTDTAIIQESPSANKESLELPLGSMTQSRAKRFKEAVSALVDQVLGENLVGLIDQTWTTYEGYIIGYGKSYRKL
ncbi:hypothetical protein J1N35_037082 [Gossypium stocksii]|uniref:Uncharacterized protein n=1 Tax=Gossypium stocksii TaxID=47602 RepID=A0A9D3UJF9_9ROSI|nr:hypothetical protein J1N35_037082 [Gossypium stocksii]